MRKFYLAILIAVFLSGFMPVNFTMGADAQISDSTGKKIEAMEALKKQAEDCKQKDAAVGATRQDAELGTLKNIENKSRGLDVKSFDYEQLKNKITKEIERPNYVPGEVLVKFKDAKINLQYSSGAERAKKFAEDKNFEKKEDLAKSNISILKTKGGETTEEILNKLKNDPNIEYAEPNYIQPWASNTPSDPGFINSWGLHNADSDADIDAPEAWDISTGLDSVVVAVLDSGVAYNHPDLIDNMWDGSTGCKNENNQDIFCPNHGWDYTNNDNDPFDDDGHGTHVAGIIGAEGNNGIGVAGVNWSVKLMALKVGNYSGAISGDVVKAIDFAINNNIKIINASFGGEFFSQSQYDAIDRFGQAGGIFIAAAGNESANNDDTHFYPSDYDLDNIISVAATNQNDGLASFSNYGDLSVDVGAPGVNIYSTVNNSEIFSEDFEGVSTPSIGNNFTQSGDNTWGTLRTIEDPITFISSDYASLYNGLDYQNNIISFLDSSAVNLSGAANSFLQFDLLCDAEENYDFLGLLFYNGSDWEAQDIYTGLFANTFKYPLFNYLNSNFQFSFGWITDESNIGGPYLGCIVDNIKIKSYSDGSDELYNFMNGTSMAAPHVAGLAALIWGYKPELTSAEVKNTILTTGDELPSLDGKTVSGKRINAFNALQSLSPEGLTISGTVKYYDGTKPVPGATVILEDDQEAQLSVAVTDENGYYEFTGLGSGENYVVRVEKDDTYSTNGVSVMDLIKMKKHIIKIEVFDNIFKIIAGDVNDSGAISVMDLIKTKKYIIKMENIPSASWKFYSSDAALTEENYLTEGLARNYNNLTAGMTEQNFTGIKMGDVNNSWTNN